MIHTGLCGVHCFRVHNIIKVVSPTQNFNTLGQTTHLIAMSGCPTSRWGGRTTNKPREILSQYLQNPLYGSLPASCYLNKTLLNSPLVEVKWPKPSSESTHHHLNLPSFNLTLSSLCNHIIQH